MRGYLHGDGIILRNIKSANILLDAQVKAELYRIAESGKHAANGILLRANEAGVKKELLAVFRKLEKDGATVQVDEIPLPLRSPLPSSIFYEGEGSLVTFSSVPVKKACLALT